MWKKNKLNGKYDKDVKEEENRKKQENGINLDRNVSIHLNALFLPGVDSQM